MGSEDDEEVSSIALMVGKELGERPQDVIDWPYHVTLWNYYHIRETTEREEIRREVESIKNMERTRIAYHASSTEYGASINEALYKVREKAGLVQPIEDALAHMKRLEATMQGPVTITSIENGG